MPDGTKLPPIDEIHRPILDAEKQFLRGSRENADELATAGRVFLEFVRAPGAKRHAAEGTGIGLAIAREVVEAHGGRLLADSREGEGSVFTVALPLSHRPPEVERLLREGNETGYRADTPGRASPTL